jgi:cytidine deaminase
VSGKPTDASVLDSLLDAARVAAETAYAPYSAVRVGAAILWDDDSVVTAGNVENASYPLSICAEAAAVTRGVAEGHGRIRAVAVFSDTDVISPCGGCRQILAEFASPDTVVVWQISGEPVTVRLSELLPYAFDLHGPERGRDAKASE